MQDHYKGIVNALTAAADSKAVGAIKNTELIFLARPTANAPFRGWSKSKPADRRRTLAVLTDNPSNGHTKAIMRVDGFTTALLAGLVRAGLATESTERVGRGKSVAIVRLRITEAGRGTMTR